jgi:putative membrane protein
MKTKLATLVLLTTVACAGVVFAKDDDKARHFLRDALQGDNSEVMLGKMAAERGDSPALKHYGQMLFDDHSMHRDKVLRAGSGFGLPDDRQPMDMAARERDKLERLHGRDFDREFAKYMVKDHRKDIAEYEKAERMRGDVGRLARETLPTLHKHLREAERLGG